MTHANLMMDRGGHKLSREDLSKIPTPKGTDSWKPVPHVELIKSIEQHLLKNDMKIISEEYGVCADGAELYGVMVIDRKIGGKEGTAAIGLRASNNKKLAIQICAGFQVFVCENLAFRGDFIALKRKHTSGLVVDEEIDEAISILKDHFVALSLDIGRLKKQTITDSRAKVLIHDVFAKGIMPSRLLPDTSHAYFIPPHKEFNPRTMWSLYNAFTETVKQMPMRTRLESTQKLGELFGLKK